MSVVVGGLKTMGCVAPSHRAQDVWASGVLMQKVGQIQELPTQHDEEAGCRVVGEGSSSDQLTPGKAKREEVERAPSRFVLVQVGITRSLRLLLRRWRWSWGQEPFSSESAVESGSVTLPQMTLSREFFYASRHRHTVYQFVWFQKRQHGAMHCFRKIGPAPEL
jgi:hypothetical protein